MKRTPVRRYDITYEYRADFDGHEVAGHIIARDIIEAARLVGDDRSWGQDRVEVRFLAEVKRTTCCQRGDWHGADHQPAEAWLFVPHTTVHRFRGEPKTAFIEETTEAYRWECEYCGRVGTRAELDA